MIVLVLESLIRVFTFLSCHFERSGGGFPPRSREICMALLVFMSFDMGCAVHFFCTEKTNLKTYKETKLCRRSVLISFDAFDGRLPQTAFLWVNPFASERWYGLGGQKSVLVQCFSRDLKLINGLK